MRKIQILLIVCMLCPFLTLSALAADGPGRSARKHLKNGQDAYEKAEYEQARTHLTKAIEEYPDYAEAYLHLARVEMKENKIRQAMAHFTRAAAINPGLSEAQLGLGRIYMAARQPGEALYRAESVLKNEPNHIDAILLKGSALLAQKKNTEVIGLLDPLYQSGQHDPNLILLLAGAHAQSGASGQAAAALKAGIADHPDAIALHLQLANVHLQTGDLQSAQQAMETVVRLEPGNIRHTIALARLYRKSDAGEKADQLLTRGLEQDPGNPARRIAVANYYLETRNAGHARDLLHQGIEHGDPGAQLRLALSELYVKTGNTPAAIDLLKKGLDAVPADDVRTGDRLRNALAGIYLAAGDAGAAQTYASAVLENDANNTQALLNRGMALKAAGHPDQAVADFERLVRLKPDAVDGYLQLADAHVRNHQVRKAKAILNTGLGLAPGNNRLRMAAYRVCLQDKDYKQAEEHLRTVVEEDPNAVDAQAELGDFYLALNDESSARREYSEIVLKSPHAPIGHIKLARFYARQGKTDSAIEQLHKGYALTTQNPSLAEELTTMLTAADRPDDALALCDARLAENPKEALAHYLKGKIFTDMKKYKDAQKAFEQACAIEPNWIRAGNDLAALFLLQDKKKQAINQFKTTLAGNPQNPAACMSLGRLYEEQHAYDEAIGIYETGVSRIPGFWSGANRLAFLLADRATSVETLERAHQLASAAYRMKPGQATIIDTLAWIHHKKGETAKALNLYEQLTAAAPNDPVINYHMAVVLRKNGDRELAREKLQAATRDTRPFDGREHAEAMLKELEAKS